MAEKDQKSTLSPEQLLAMIVPAKATKDFQTYNKATKELKAGVGAAEVFKKYGIFEGLTDKNLRSIISDAGAEFKPGVLDEKFSTSVLLKGGKHKLEDILKHDELFKAMPELKNVEIEHSPGRINGAYFSPAKNKIGLGMVLDASSGMAPKETLLATLLHETQHAVQSSAGFPGGSSPDRFYGDANAFSSAESKIKAMENHVKSKNFETASPAYKEQTLKIIDSSKKQLQDVKKEAYTRYSHNPGEIEARVTELLRKQVKPESPNSPENLKAAGVSRLDLVKQDLSHLPAVDSGQGFLSLARSLGIKSRATPAEAEQIKASKINEWVAKPAPSSGMSTLRDFVGLDKLSVFTTLASYSKGLNENEKEDLAKRRDDNSPRRVSKSILEK